MRGCDLHQPRAEPWIHQLIRDDRDGPAGQRQFDLRPDQTGVTLVLGIHRHTGIPEHGLRPSRRNGEVPRPVRKSTDGLHVGLRYCRLGDRGGLRSLVPLRRSKRIPQVIEPALDLFTFGLFVGQRRQTTGAPVDNVLPPIDQILLVKAHEHLADGPAEPFVQRKACTVPIAARPDDLELLQDPASRPVYVPPNPLDEGFPAKIVPRGPVLCQLSLDDVLRRDPGVVGPWDPERDAALHSPPANHHVLDRIVEPVTHVKDVGHVRRRDHDDVRIRATRQRGFGLDVEVPSLSPGTVEGTFDGLWI